MNEPAPPRYAAGDLVHGRYRIERLLGRGGMGDVYRAVDEQADRPVALKMIQPELADSEKTVRRFAREAELSLRIDHPNVMRIYEMFTVVDGDGREIQHMAMELLDGESLADRLARSKPEPMSLEEARPVIEQMAAGLAAAHDAGVIHRDLKPDNVILVPDGADGVRVVLNDFGVARYSDDAADSKVESLTATNVILGTPTYMAPEQLELEMADAVSDIYTMGLVIYEMVTAQLPFTGDSPLQAVFARVKEDAPSPRTYRADLPPAWESAILRCLARDPAERFQRATEVVRALDDDPPGGTGVPWRWIAAVGGLLLTVVSLLLLL